MTWNKPRPNIPEDMKSFWAALKEHKFVLWHCKVCDAWYWPPASCRNHPNEPYMGNMEWKEASGYGKVFTPLESPTFQGGDERGLLTRSLIGLFTLGLKTRFPIATP